MDSIKKVFTRMDLCEISGLLLNGMEGYGGNRQLYQTKLKSESNAIYARLKSIYQNEEDFDEACVDLVKAFTAYEFVYTEIGMKAGARLVHQLLLTDDPFHE